MKESTYLERAMIEGSFKTKADATHWCVDKAREGYTVTKPYKNPFAFSHDLPWEADATASFTIESRRS